jgi:branched-chain amino acid transport system ATP-binding protein
VTGLTAEALVKHYGGVRAVGGVSLALSPGEIVALIGPNGAGKSTTFAMLGGQIRPDSGRVLHDGIPLSGIGTAALARRGIARTFQVAQVFGSMPAAECVQTALAAHHGETAGLGRALAHRRRTEADALLDRVGLPGAGDTLAGTLAHGDVKRLELAMALAGAPRLLLMDEPTAGMAPAERRRLMALVAGLVTETGLGVLFTEHDMDVVFAHAGRILVLDRGCIIAEGAPDAIRADAKVRAVYLGEDA